jgi:DNA (cytosine-5)-methyltransferase 1
MDHVEFTYGSLCTGYDGIGMGLRLAGLALDSRWCAETETSVAGLLTSPNVGDITVADWSGVQHPKIMSSGDPCQPVSVAGRREGRKDPRFLWPYVRTAYRALRSERLFFENVQGIVSHDEGRTLAERLDNLRDDGYAVRWTVLGACAVGAPHHRHRWYALATRVGPSAPEAVRVGRKAYCGAPRSGGRVLLPTPNAREGGERGFPSREHAERRRDNPERSLNLEDAIATLLPTPCATRSGNNRGGAAGRVGEVRPSLDSVHALLPTPRATGGANGGPGQRGSAGDLAMPSAVQPRRWGRYAEAVALWESITGIPAPAPTVPGPNGGVRLNPALPEWMMGLAPGTLTDHMERSDALKAAGNGCVPQAVAAAWCMLAD